MACSIEPLSLRDTIVYEVVHSRTSRPRDSPGPWAEVYQVTRTHPMGCRGNAPSNGTTKRIALLALLIGLGFVLVGVVKSIYDSNKYDDCIQKNLVYSCREDYNRKTAATIGFFSTGVAALCLALLPFCGRCCCAFNPEHPTMRVPSKLQAEVPPNECQPTPPSNAAKDLGVASGESGVVCVDVNLDAAVAHVSVCTTGLDDPKHPLPQTPPHSIGACAPQQQPLTSALELPCIISSTMSD